MSIEKSEFEIMDALDERQIASELKGEIIEEYFYEFPQGNRQIVGLSYSGVKHVARMMSERGHPISIEELSVISNNDAYVATAVSMDLTTKEKRYGAATQPKIMKLRDGKEQEDPFAYQKAVSKAQRNALRQFIPEVVIQEGYRAWKQRGKAIADAANRGQLV